MHIRHIFHTEDDLKRRLSQRFMRRWKRMLALYEKHSHRLPKAVVLKCISVAWAFCSSVTDGNADVPCRITDVLEHNTCERIEIGGELFACEEEETVEQLIWDTVCLLLEEEEPQPEWQYAFDMAGVHSAYAYKKEVMEEGSAPSDFANYKEDTSRGNMQAVQTTTLGKEVAEQIDWMEFIADRIKMLQTKSITEREHGVNSLARIIVEKGIVLPLPLREELLHLDDEREQPVNYNIEVNEGGTNICHTDKVTI